MRLQSSRSQEQILPLISPYLPGGIPFVRWPADMPLRDLGVWDECDLYGRMVKIWSPAGICSRKASKPLLVAQESIGPQGLHETLCRSFPEKVLEEGPIKISTSVLPQPVIKRQELVSARCRRNSHRDRRGESQDHRRGSRTRIPWKSMRKGAPSRIITFCDWRSRCTRQRIVVVSLCARAESCVSSSRLMEGASSMPRYP